jgi:hypothetical protein
MLSSIPDSVTDLVDDLGLIFTLFEFCFLLLCKMALKIEEKKNLCNQLQSSS